MRKKVCDCDRFLFDYMEEDLKNNRLSKKEEKQRPVDLQLTIIEMQNLKSKIDHYANLCDGRSMQIRIKQFVLCRDKLKINFPETKAITQANAYLLSLGIKG